ncbi:hypothetical protein D3C78_813970 [compost metagenome]
MGQVLAALRLEHVGMMAVGLVEELAQRVHFRQMRDRSARAGVGKPDAVVQAEAGVAVHRDAEAVAEQLLLDHAAQRLAFRLHRRAAWAAVPGQARTQALAADQEGDALLGVQRRVAHQVDPLRIGTGAAPQPAGVDHRHEHQAHALELLQQQAVPAQARRHAAQEGQHHGRADPLEAVHAAEVADRRRARRRIAEADRVHRQTARADVHPAQLAHLQQIAELVDQPLEFEEFAGLTGGHATSEIRDRAPCHQSRRCARPHRRRWRGAGRRQSDGPDRVSWSQVQATSFRPRDSAASRRRRRAAPPARAAASRPSARSAPAGPGRSGRGRGSRWSTRGYTARPAAGRPPRH